MPARTGSVEAFEASRASALRGARRSPEREDGGAERAEIPEGGGGTIERG